MGSNEKGAQGSGLPILRQTGDLTLARIGVVRLRAAGKAAQHLRQQHVNPAAQIARRKYGQVFNLKSPPLFSLSDQQTYAGDRQLPGGWGQVSCLTGKRET